MTTINTLNIHRNWLLRLAALAGNMFVTLSKEEARGYCKRWVREGFVLVLADSDLGIYGYEHADGSSWLFFTYKDRMCMCRNDMDSKGLRANIASELQTLYYTKTHSKPAPIK